MHTSAPAAVAPPTHVKVVRHASKEMGRRVLNATVTFQQQLSFTYFIEKLSETLELIRETASARVPALHLRKTRAYAVGGRSCACAVVQDRG